MVDNSEDESSDENSHFKKSKIKQDKKLYQDLFKRFAEFVGSTLNDNSTPENKVTSSQPNNFKINNNNNDKSFQANDVDKKYLCVLCKMAFTKSGAKAHRKQHHSDLPKYSRIHEAILIEKDTKIVDASKIIEGNKETRKRHIISDEKSQVLTKSKSDEEKGNNNQDGREDETPKKRKPDENKDNENPSIFKCKRCTLSFVSAETIEKHFKECQTLSKSSKICDACGLKFTEGELITHVFKHHVTNKNYKKFCILVVSNITIVENNYGILKENISPSKTNTDITESSEDEFEPKKNLVEASRQEINKRNKKNTNGNKKNTDGNETRVTNCNDSQTITNTQQDNNCNQSTQKCACKTLENKNTPLNINDSQKKNLKTPQKISANTKKDILSYFKQVSKTNSNATAQNLLKAVSPAKQQFKAISRHPKRRYSYDGFSIYNEKAVAKRDPNGYTSVQHIDSMKTAEIQTQIEVERDINTNNSKTSPVNSNVEINLTRKPLKISKNPRRRLTYHDGLTFSQSSLAEHCNVQAIGDIDNIGKKTFVTSAEVHSHEEKGRDKRVQIATGKTCAEIRIEKNINVTNITNVNTQTHEATVAVVRKNIHAENTISEPNGEQKHAYTNIAKNTQREIDISRIEEEVFKLYKCSECNVCYLSPSACDTHMRDHKPKDPDDCSKCNDCGFVFTNHSLGKHKKNCPGHNIDKVIVDEYRLVVKDDKVVKEVFHVQYVIRNKDENSVSSPGIVNSETTYGSDVKQQNSDNSRFDLSDNVVETNMNVIENDARNNIHSIPEDIGKIKDIEGQSNLQSNEMVRLYISNEETEATLTGTRNAEESFICNSTETNNAVCIGKDKAADVSVETAKIITYVEYNQQNKEVPGLISKEGRCSTFENYTPNKVSAQQEEKRNNDKLLPQTSFEVPTVIENAQTTQRVIISPKSAETQQEEKRNNDKLLPQTSFEVPTVIENTQTSQQVIISPKSAEFLEPRGVVNGAEGFPNAGEELTKHDDSTTEHVGDIAIIKTETITEDITNTGEKSNMTQHVVEIFDHYFEDQNIVTVIDSDDDSDCEIVYVEQKRNRRNNKQKINHMITYADELSSSSERTMILEYEENNTYSLPDFIKPEL